MSEATCPIVCTSFFK